MIAYSIFTIAGFIFYFILLWIKSNCTDDDGNRILIPRGAIILWGLSNFIFIGVMVSFGVLLGWSCDGLTWNPSKENFFNKKV